MFGLPSTLPIYITPTALMRLGHPDGEMNAVRAAGQEGILQGVNPCLIRPLSDRILTDLLTVDL